MKIFFDTEFIEDGKTIELISIGMVREDGKEYYAQSKECDKSRAGDWVKANVLPLLKGSLHDIPRDKIKQEILHFCGEEPEFWAYYGSYDWVVLCQIFGTMMDLPKHWPMYVHDIKQLADSQGNPRLPEQSSIAHDALNDAIWTKQAYEFLANRTC